MAIFSTLLIGAFGSTFAASAFGAFVIETTASIATSALVNLILAPGDTKQPAFGIQGELQTGEDVPRGAPFGGCAVDGSLVYANTWGTMGGTPNAYFTQVIACSDLPINAFNGIFIDGAYCQKIVAEPHASYGIPFSEYRLNGVDHLWIKFYDGTQTTADSFLTGTVSSADRPYQSTRVGVGVAYMIVTARINEELFTGFPTVRCVLGSIPLYDVTKDTTAGGSGTQRWNNPATWGGSGDKYPIVQAYNILRGISYDGTWVYGFQGTAEAQLPAADWIAAISACSASVTLPDASTEPRFRAGGYLTFNTECGDALEAVMAACAGRIADIGGIYKPRVGIITSYVASITADDIISTEPQSSEPIKRLAESVNAVMAKYPSDPDGWNIKDAPPLYNSDFEDEDRGIRLPVSLNLTNVPFFFQVQRLQGIALKEARRARRHTFTLGPEFWALEPNDIIRYTDEALGYSTKQFLINAVLDRPDAHVVVDMVEITTDDYDLDAWGDYPEATERTATAVISRPPAQEVKDFEAESVTLNDGSRNRKQGIRLTWDADAMDGVDHIRYQVRLAEEGIAEDNTFDGIPPSLVLDFENEVYGSDPMGWLWSDADPAPSLLLDFENERYGADAAWADPRPIRAKLRGVVDRRDGEKIIADGILNSADYEVRVRPIAPWATAWSDWQQVTTGAELVELADFRAIIPLLREAEIATFESVSSLPVTGNFTGRLARLTTNGLFYEWDGAAWVTPHQPSDSDLTTIAGLSASNDDILQRKAGAWAARSVAQVKTDLGLPDKSFCVLTADYVLTSTTATQKLFNTTTNGALTLPTGRYAFSVMAYLFNMDGAVTGNGLVSINGGGTATIDELLYLTNGVDNTAPQNAATHTGSGGITGTVGSSVVSTSTGTRLIFEMNGTFKVTATGTIIPSIALNTAAAASVSKGSFVIVEHLDAGGAASSGSWS